MVGIRALLPCAVEMVEQVEMQAGGTLSADEVVAEIARHAHLPGEQVCELLGDDDLAGLVGRLAADVARTHEGLELIGPCLSRQAVADLLGVTHQAVAKRDGIDLLALRAGGGRRCRVRYPAFIFDGSRPLVGLAGVLEQLRPLRPAGGDVAVWLRTPNSECDGDPPERALRDGRQEQVGSAARPQARAWQAAGSR